MSIAAAIDHLNSLLPLKDRQLALAPSLRALHRDILRGFAEAGAPPTRAQIAARPGLGDADAALAHLAGDDLIVLTPDRSGVAGAYPFTAEPRAHRVQVNGHAVHAMCALDALAVAPMFETGTRIDSRCHVSKRPIRILMQGAQVTDAQPARPRVGIRWQSTSGCAAQTLCMEMVFLYDRAMAEAWRQEDPGHIDIFDLPDAVHFAAAFFRPLLD
ncbi:MAG TPA: alkylmercury lyase family protein [Gammaproteobacteria bacterium]|nr:alkylmercury lyase family protein [Gammaproteobacteria bacterium]